MAREFSYSKSNVSGKMCIPKKESIHKRKKVVDPPVEDDSNRTVSNEQQQNKGEELKVRNKDAGGGKDGSHGSMPKNTNKVEKDMKSNDEMTTKSFKYPRGQKDSIKKGEEWILRLLNTGVLKTVEEFRALARWKPDDMTNEAGQANKDKNRYLDVPCQDAKRVVLQHPGLDSDFIHANYVATPRNEKRFICTQGPLEGTQFSFWAMVIQENVHAVVMLCNTVECGKLKCFQYWPEKKAETMTFGENEGAITVLNQSGGQPMNSKEKEIRQTKLLIKWKEGERTVTHYQWMDWPDRGVPKTTQTALSLINAVRNLSTPILVHCSAGIGRTGTIVAIAYVQEKMQDGEYCMAMDELLKTIRSQRPYSIQNEMQYLYLHKVLLTYLVEKHKERFGRLLTEPENKAKYEKWCAEYEKITTFG